METWPAAWILPRNSTRCFRYLDPMGLLRKISGGCWFMAPIYSAENGKDFLPWNMQNLGRK